MEWVWKGCGVSLEIKKTPKKARRSSIKRIWTFQIELETCLQLLLPLLSNEYRYVDWFVRELASGDTIVERQLLNDRGCSGFAVQSSRPIRSDTSIARGVHLDSAQDAVALDIVPVPFRSRHRLLPFEK